MVMVVNRVLTGNLQGGGKILNSEFDLRLAMTPDRDPRVLEAGGTVSVKS